MGFFAELIKPFRTPDVGLAVLQLRVKRLPRGKSCVIEVRNDQSFTELDLAIRRALGYSGWDHCSAFFSGVPWESRCVAEAYPDNRGPGQFKPVSTLPLLTETGCGYVYDFGNNRLHTITLLDLLPVDPEKEYPSIVKKRRKSRSKDEKQRLTKTKN